jgi:hypothetical protein
MTSTQAAANRSFAALADSVGMDAEAAERTYGHLIAITTTPQALWYAMDAYLHTLANRQEREARANDDRADLWACFRLTDAAIGQHSERFPA